MSGKKRAPKVPPVPAVGLRKYPAVLPWAACAAASVLHLVLLYSVPLAGANALAIYLGIVLLPGLLTMILLPGAWGYWYRWAALAGLSVATFSDMFIAVLLIGETWALHRSWEVERGATLRDLFRLRSAPRIKEA